jgi:hypothetical protein
MNDRNIESLEKIQGQSIIKRWIYKQNHFL